MAQYILKRLLIMVPTFLLITVVVFGVINLAPGQPGQASAGASGNEQANANANAREGYRLFKEQYNLDKPILLNFRFTLDWQDIGRRLETLARNNPLALPGEAEALRVGATAARVLGRAVNAEYNALQVRLANPDLSDEQRQELQRELQRAPFAQIEAIRPPRPASGDVFDAEELVEDWGNVIVPHLMAIANGYVHLVPADADSPWFDGRGVLASELGGGPYVGGETVHFDGESYTVHPVLTEKVRFLAVQRLSVNAQRRLIIRPGVVATDEERALNREIMTENQHLLELTYAIGASAEERAEVLAEWNAWFDANGDRFALGLGDKVRMLFLDTRFARYWGNLAKLDLGTSIRHRRPVLQVIGEHWQYSIYLSVISLLLAYFISIPMGVIAAVKQNSFWDRGIAILLFVLYSLPSFFVATLLQSYYTPASVGIRASSGLIFGLLVATWLGIGIWAGLSARKASERRRPTIYKAALGIGAACSILVLAITLLLGKPLFPVAGFYGQDPKNLTTLQMFADVAWHLLLPVFCLTYASLAVLSRYARTGLLDVIRSDYIRTARAKGLPEWMVILKHAVRNGMIPILTLLGTTLPVLIGGSIIIEVIFGIDGMGALMIEAIQYRDYNVIMGILLISSILTLVGILLSDISYALVDPRISFD